MLTTKNVNSIRMIAMFGILCIHSTMFFASSLFTENYTFIGSQANFEVFSFLVSTVKFSTIIFFLISGYLFELNRSKYIEFKPFIRVKNKSLLKPYLIIFFIPIFLFIGIIQPFFGVKKAISLAILGRELFAEIFLSNYWFIPVLLLYFILNFFIPYRWVKKLLPLTVCITLFYSFNLYFNFIKTQHSLAFLGFLSFFFFGRMQVHKVYKPVKLEVKVCVVALLLLLSLIESHLLYFHFHQIDAWNTLKLSNLAYSISVAVLLKEMPQFPARYLRVNTYYIYLFHPHLFRIVAIVCYKLNYKLLFYSWPVSLLFIASFIFVCLLLERIYAFIKRNGHIPNISGLPSIKAGKIFGLSESHIK